MVPSWKQSVILLLIASIVLVSGCMPEHDIRAQVWSDNSPNGETYEFKVNCGEDYPILETCFLYDLDAVRVIGPDGRQYDLEKDFTKEEYSGLVRMRWVLYGPEGGELPLAGVHTFEFVKDSEVVHTLAVDYTQTKISYPTDVQWERRGDDLYVEWLPPEGVHSDMWYYAIIWNEPDTSDLENSKRLEWDVSSGLLEEVPFIEGGNYSLNIALYYDDGYAYSEYAIFTW